MRKRFLNMNLEKGSEVYVSFEDTDVHIIDDTIKSLIPGLGAMKI